MSTICYSHIFYNTWADGQMNGNRHSFVHNLQLQLAIVSRVINDTHSRNLHSNVISCIPKRPSVVVMPVDCWLPHLLPMVQYGE